MHLLPSQERVGLAWGKQAHASTQLCCQILLSTHVLGRAATKIEPEPARGMGSAQPRQQAHPKSC